MYCIVSFLVKKRPGATFHVHVKKNRREEEPNVYIYIYLTIYLSVFLSTGDE